MRRSLHNYYIFYVFIFSAVLLLHLAPSLLIRFVPCLLPLLVSRRVPILTPLFLIYVVWRLGLCPKFLLLVGITLPLVVHAAPLFLLLQRSELLCVLHLVPCCVPILTPLLLLCVVCRPEMFPKSLLLVVTKKTSNKYSLVDITAVQEVNFLRVEKEKQDHYCLAFQKRNLPRFASLANFFDMIQKHISCVNKNSCLLRLSHEVFLW